MKLSDRIMEALFTADDGAVGRAFKAAYAMAIEHDERDNLLNECVDAHDESYMCMVLIHECLFEEEEKNG